MRERLAFTSEGRPLARNAGSTPSMVRLGEVALEQSGSDSPVWRAMAVQYGWMAFRRSARRISIWSCCIIATVLMAVGSVIAWLIGCASVLLLLNAVIDAVWWHYTRDQHAGVAAIGLFAGSVATFALIPTILWLKYKLSGGSELQLEQARVAPRGWDSPR
jgi:hypothetical protein